MTTFHVPLGLPITTCQMCFKRAAQVDGGAELVWIDYDARPQTLLDESFPLRRPELNCRRAGCPLMLADESEADNVAP